jgi:phosphoribosylanthranilate isomerase
LAAQPSTAYDIFMFRVKICGITTPEDGAYAIRAGADAIGLNFYSGSRRCVDRQRADQIIGALPSGAIKVGVFVNASAAEVHDTADALRLEFVQLHGDEPPEMLAELADLQVIRAFRFGPLGWDPCRSYLDCCDRLASLPCALLVDAYRQGEYGGTGEAPDWPTIRKHRELHLGLPLILAGGLRPDNVARAIAIAEPYSVDTASGVESSPGVKDHSKLASFVAAARRAFGDGERKA